MSASIASKSIHDHSRLGDHPALDFLNTVSMVDGQLVDSLQRDGDVTSWLKRAGLAVEAEAALPPGDLLRAAVQLRDTIRAAVERRKSGKPLPAVSLNGLLAKSESHLELVSRRGGDPEIRRRWRGRTAEEILGPLAEAAAELLATGDFSLVRPCEGQDCVLWFYDRTKSHHRRWCSTATCGNRNKVAAFRSRKRLAKT